MEVIWRPGEGMVDGEVEERGGEVLHRKEEEEKGEEEEMEMIVEEGVEMLRMTALRPATRKEAKPPTNISTRICIMQYGFVTRLCIDFFTPRFHISCNFYSLTLG